LKREVTAPRLQWSFFPRGALSVSFGGETFERETLRMGALGFQYLPRGDLISINDGKGKRSFAFEEVGQGKRKGEKGPFPEKGPRL